jgi:Lrp/AsnC family transcriptional regulator, leucine-responsive regulatory protein
MPQHSSASRVNTVNGVPDPLLDEINVALLNELQADPRLSMSALGRRVGMSSPAVTERVRRLEEAGVIAGYRMVVDPRALGLPVSAYVRIRPTLGQLTKIAELAASIPQVTECHRMTGEDCMLLKVHAADIEQIETVLDQFLVYGQTTTSIVVSTPVPTRPLPLPGPAGNASTARTGSSAPGATKPPSHFARTSVHEAGRRR